MSVDVNFKMQAEVDLHVRVYNHIFGRETSLHVFKVSLYDIRI